ncbi:hypothetical protein KCH_42350 [Kitasatospora cheerisanensis KCTC 2395]|uniref:ROK family protein n=1 Tax=Kitasatospora cheerisanensis KCTC 2395 TaxID=1348663 RepID=A0A066YWT4_9ACTN|nr:hypothetical protein KCH_42350 [Kitasatospora cheerisanensis KCTC 2395]
MRHPAQRRVDHQRDGGPARRRADRGVRLRRVGRQAAADPAPGRPRPGPPGRHRRRRDPGPGHPVRPRAHRTRLRRPAVGRRSGPGPGGPADRRRPRARPRRGGRPGPQRARRRPRRARHRRAGRRPRPRRGRRRARPDLRLGRRPARPPAARPHPVAAAHRQRRQDPRPGRDVVRCGPRLPGRRGRAVRLRHRRVRGRGRPPLPRREQLGRRVGHTKVHVGGRPCRCGARGCLEAYVGAAALVERWDGALPGVGEKAGLAALLAAAEAGRPGAVALLDEAAELLGAAVADLVNLFAPERVVIGGWAGLLLGPRLLPAIEESATRHALAFPRSRTALALSELGPDAVTLGAATLPLCQFLESGGTGAR